MTIFKFFRGAVIAGNIVYILWILYNGMEEGFKGIATVQAVVLFGLIILLSANIFLLSRKS